MMYRLFCIIVQRLQYVVMTLCLAGAFLSFFNTGITIIDNNFIVKFISRPFMVPDEGRYVEIPREMVAAGDYVTPRLNGVKYFEKPPLYYWMQAGALKLFGSGEAGMRLWGLLLFFLSVTATYAFVNRFTQNRRQAVFSAGILAGSLLYFVMSQIITLDMPVTVFVTLSLYCFYAGMQAQPGWRRRLLWYGFSVCCACGILTKGLMALAVPGPVIVTWLTLNRRWGELRPFYGPSAVLLFALVAVPWHVLVQLKNPEFLHKYFYVEHFVRYSSDYHSRYQPLWFFVPVFLLGFMPWSPHIPAVVRQSILSRRDPLVSFAIIWALWVLLFFSISNSKLVPYILPMFAPAAILTSMFYVKSKVRTVQASLLLFAFIGAGAAWFMRGRIVNEISPEALWIAFAICGAAVICALVYPVYRQRALAVFGVWMMCTGMAVAPKVQTPSLKPVAHYLRRMAAHGEEIISVKSYFQDLPFYLDQRVTVAGSKGELMFGTTVEDTSAWMIDIPEFLRRWQTKPVWAVMRRSAYERFKDEHPNFADPQETAVIAIEEADFYVLLHNRKVGANAG